MVSASFEEILKDRIAQQCGAHIFGRFRICAWQSFSFSVGLQHDCAPARGATQIYADAVEECGVAASSSEEADISKLLQLSDALTVAELCSIRRRFALCNHPDRVDAYLQPVALRRMQTANELIDRAMEKRRNVGRSPQQSGTTRCT